jgi:hypothetical protein
MLLQSSYAFLCGQVPTPSAKNKNPPIIDSHNPLPQKQYFSMISYNGQHNAQVFYLFINLPMPYILRAFFYPIFRGGCTISAWFKSPGYGVSARALTPYPGDLNHAEVVHLPLKMG